MASEVAFDESGNTGDNLLDRSQPIYTLASIQLAEDDAEALIDEAVPSRDGELKYSSLRRSRVGREAIVRILGSDLMKPGRARVTAMHKPFSTVGVVGYPKESLRQLLCDARTLSDLLDWERERAQEHDSGSMAAPLGGLNEDV